VGVTVYLLEGLTVGGVMLELEKPLIDSRDILTRRGNEVGKEVSHILAHSLPLSRREEETLALLHQARHLIHRHIASPEIVDEEIQSPEEDIGKAVVERETPVKGCSKNVF